jgi:GAF domain-containing protein
MTLTRDVQRWLTHLTQMSGSLTSSLDYDTTLREVVRLPIPTLADWCMVYIPDDGGTMPARLALAHASPLKEALLRKVWHREWSRLPEEHPIVESLRKRTPVVVKQLETHDIQRLSRVPEDAHTLHRVGIQSLLILPLVAHGTLIGGFMLVSSGARGRGYDETHVDLLVKLAQCYAQAIYNARLFIEARQALRHREELISATRHELLELAASMTQYPQTVQREIDRIAHRLGSFADPYTAA